MGARNILRLLTDALVGSDSVDLASGETLTILPVVDDQGSVEIGDGTTDMDVKIFLGATTDYVEFNVGDGQLNIEGAELHLGDTDTLEFGDATGGDMRVAWDGTQLEFLPATDDTGAVNFGDGTTDMDVKVFLGASTDFVLFDVGNGQVTFDSAELQMGDNDGIEFGDGADVVIEWNGTYMEGSQASNAMWNNAPVPVDPNTTADAITLVDDFFELDTTATVGKWAAFNVGTGTTTLADDADAAGGVLLMTCQATTDDAAEQLNLVSAPFFLAAGKDLWFECRFKLEGDVAQSEIAIGLCALSENLTAVADVKAADGIIIHKQDGAATMGLTASKNGTDTGENADIGTLVLSTYTTVGFFVNGVTDITPYVDGVADTAITATIPDDESLGICLLVRNGDGTAQEIMHVDYVKVVQLR